MKEFKENDVFLWSWTEEELKKRQDSIQAGTLYWCCSNICIANDSGVLKDTFWSSSSENKIVDPEKVDLVYLGNLDDYEKVSGEWEFENYADKDCLNLTHSNCSRGLWYVRKGAQFCPVKKKRVLEQKLHEVESEISYLNRRKEDLERELGKL